MFYSVQYTSHVHTGIEGKHTEVPRIQNNTGTVVGTTVPGYPGTVLL